MGLSGGPRSMPPYRFHAFWPAVEGVANRGNMPQIKYRFEPLLHESTRIHTIWRTRAGKSFCTENLRFFHRPPFLVRKFFFPAPRAVLGDKNFRQKIVHIRAGFARKGPNPYYIFVCRFNAPCRKREAQGVRWGQSTRSETCPPPSPRLGPCTHTVRLSFFTRFPENIEAKIIYIKAK